MQFKKKSTDINSPSNGNAMFRALSGASTVQVSEIQKRVIRVTFTDDGIGGSSEHLDELDAIRTAGENDVVVLYFTGCPGGAVNTGMALINAILATPAKTIAVLEGRNASLATIVPLHCDEIVVTPHCSFMLHSAHGGAWGTMGNMERQAAFSAKAITRFMDDVYKGFVTPEEMQRLRDGVEIYLTDDEIEERLEKRAEVLRAEAQKDQKEMEEALMELVELTNLEVEPTVAPKKKLAAKKAAKKTTKK